MITKITTNSHEEWLALRHQYIGGSDAAAVVGLNPWVSPYALWAEKTGKTPGFEGNLATEVGTFLEEFVAKKFAEETGKKVRRVNQSFLNDQYPWAIANIDRDIVGEDAGLEIKTTDSLNMGKFKNGEYPANYYVQCMHYMAVTGKARWFLAVMIGNREFKIFEIERDEAEIAALMTAEKHFFEHMKNDTPPALDGSQATSKVLAATYPQSTDTHVDLFGYEANLRMYDQLSAQIKALEAERELHANTIKEFMGTHAKGDSENFRVSWSTAVRRSLNTKKLLADHPEINADDYTTSSNYRTFKVSKKG